MKLLNWERERATLTLRLRDKYVGTE